MQGFLTFTPQPFNRSNSKESNKSGENKLFKLSFGNSNSRKLFSLWGTGHFFIYVAIWRSVCSGGCHGIEYGIREGGQQRKRLREMSSEIFFYSQFRLVYWSLVLEKLLASRANRIERKYFRPRGEEIYLSSVFSITLSCLDGNLTSFIQQLNQNGRDSEIYQEFRSHFTDEQFRRANGLPLP